MHIIHYPGSSAVDMQSYDLCSDLIDVVIDISCIYGCVLFCTVLISVQCTIRRTVGENTDSAYDSKSSSVITLSNGIVLYLREVTKYGTELHSHIHTNIPRGRYLALVCIVRTDNQQKLQGLIDYNFTCFRSAIQEVWCRIV